MPLRARNKENTAIANFSRLAVLKNIKLNYWTYFKGPLHYVPKKTLSKAPLGIWRVDNQR